MFDIVGQPRGADQRARFTPPADRTGGDGLNTDRVAARLRSGDPVTHYSISSMAFLATSGGSMSPMNAAASSKLPNITVRSSMWIIFP